MGDAHAAGYCHRGDLATTMSNLGVRKQGQCWNRLRVLGLQSRGYVLLRTYCVRKTQWASHEQYYLQYHKM